MYIVAICDDNFVYTDYIEKLIFKAADCPKEEFIIYKYKSGEDFINSFSEGINYDLVIMDMQMGRMDGQDTAVEFRKKYRNEVLVFCSGICHPTVKSFEVSPYRYLLKEYTDEKMISEFKKILEEVKRTRVYSDIAITYRNEFRVVPAKDIVYVSIRKHGSWVYTYEHKKHLVKENICNKTITMLYDELDSGMFEYVHNSYFVNLAHVKSIYAKEIQLSGGIKLSISKSREKAFREKFAVYLARRY